jgi:hypothetical protein
LAYPGKRFTEGEKMDFNKSPLRLAVVIFGATLPFVVGGCAQLTRGWFSEVNPVPEAQKMAERVVYTPLLPSRASTDPEKMEVLLRPPTRAYREIGLVSMYREYSHETAAILLPFVKQRAAKEGANAILLMEIGEKTVGTQTSASAVPIGDVMLANSYSTLVTEGTIRGIAIIYGE